MDVPLTVWYCDKCGKRIESIDEAYVVFKAADQNRKRGGWRIIHQHQCDEPDAYFKSMHLSHFLGADGLMNLMEELVFFEMPGELMDGDGPADMKEFVDFLCRVQIPHYEEARYLKDEIGEVGVFMSPDGLRVALETIHEERLDH